MKTLLMMEDHLREWLGEIIASGKRVIAPQSDGAFVTYEDANSVEAIDLSGRKPDFSFKNLLFPNTESVFQYRWSEGKLVVEEMSPGDGEQAKRLTAAHDRRDIVIVGATPCDAASLVVLDQVFLSDPPDPFYARRRLKLTVIGLACSHPEPECFCTSVGLSPTSSKGCDIFLTPLNMELCDGFSVGPAYLAEVLTKKGRSLIKNVEAEWIKPSKPDQEACIYSLKSARDKGIRSEMLARRELAVNPNDLRGDFQNPVWEETGRICLGCGVCAFVCPTCTCYDLTEEREGECWSRCKNWDSCGFGYFTLHASGHNPRPTQLERYRQRVMHKFSYFVEQTGTTMCVGCGRCTKFCPVGVNIYDVRQRWQ